MKKFTLISASMLLAATAFAADNYGYWYIRGAFNDYNPDGNQAWALMDDDEGDANVFTGTFTVPAGEFSFNLMNSEDQIFVPMDKNMNTVPMVVDFVDNKFSGSSSFAWDDYEESYYWTCPSWEGGLITVTVDANGNNPSIEIYAFPEGGQDESDYNKDYTIYPLTADGETAVFWEAGNIDDMWYNIGDAYIVDPAGNEITLVKNLSGQPGQVTLVTDDPYGLIIDITSLELAEGTYTVVIPAKYIQVVSNDWEDFLFNPEISYEIEVAASAEEVIYWYIRGAFNNFDPQYDDKWALMDDDESENGLYTGTFTVPAGEFSFNLLAPNGMIYIPASLSSEEVVFQNNSYTGAADYAFDEEEATYCWTNPAWAGGLITVSIDANTGVLEIYAFPESNDFNNDYTLTPLNEDGVITIVWNGAIDDVWYEEGNAYLVNGEGEEIALAKSIPGQEGQVTLLDSDPYGLSIDITSLELEAGDYTLVIPAKYIQIVSDDWETWLYNPEISYGFTVGTTAIKSIGAENGMTIYNLQGAKVNASDINGLNNGIYIINGKKVLIRK